MQDNKDKIPVLKIVFLGVIGFFLMLMLTEIGYILSGIIFGVLVAVYIAFSILNPNCKLYRIVFLGMIMMLQLVLVISFYQEIPSTYEMNNFPEAVRMGNYYITLIVGSIVAITAMILTTVHVFKEKDGAIKGLFITSFVLYIVAATMGLLAAIVGYSTLEYATKFALFYAVSIAALGIISFSDDRLKDVRIKKVVNIKKEDPTTVLAKLLELKNEGIITNDEYEEKRQNYLDKL